MMHFLIVSTSSSTKSCAKPVENGLVAALRSKKKAESYENVAVRGLPYRDRLFRVIARFSRGSFWRRIPSERSEWPVSWLRWRREG